MILGRDGLLFAGPNSRRYEELLLFHLSLLVREMFVRTFFVRTFVLDDQLKKIRMMIMDHEKDPNELVNVAGLPEHAAIVSNLQRQIRDAAKASFPASGLTPEIKKDQGLWAPQFIE